ncbi:sensor histidine kinase [Dethiosulfovibrio salsuginis]|uniref:histidine kinase n=1 Tax=Dethiosulfovibrio salsuginis TaxID=561720 RepID=A0A1X7JVS5_9BACT|nr:sensor histidine kinase [Dethiosulfovibrio salsuginis]SMG32577.1 Signal transduction histidine kinase [Dethiosulfovibrio salsuginis]
MNWLKAPFRWSLSKIFLLAVLLPAVAVVVTAGIGIYHHDRAMSRVMSSYVENLAESVASRVNAQDPRWDLPISVIGLLRQLQIFEWGPSLPGWIAVVDVDGKVLLASPGAESTLKKLWIEGIPVGKAVQLADSDGDKYTVAVWPASSTFVVAAVGWSQLIGPMVQATRLWALLMAVVAVAAVTSGFLLWYWVVSPLKDLSGEISRLNWGCDIPKMPQTPSVVELEGLREVLCRLSAAAREKVELWNRYLQDVVRVQEGEKSRIARDLHDGPVQEITALIQRLKLASLDPPEAVEGHLRLAEDIGRDTVKQLRELCTQLSPPWLDLGLKHSLDELGDRLSRYLDISVNVEVDEKVSDYPDMTLAFFRIAQEAIHNAVRHGGADTIDLMVQKDKGGTILSVKDNGSGFAFSGDLETYRCSGHRGLLNMNERINLIGGNMEITSSPGNGCALMFLVPDR